MTAAPDTDVQTPPRRITCPRCTAPMRTLQMSSHKHQPVTVDHCPDCRLVWFDQFESVHLDDLGWVRLLREMEQSAKRPLADARVARPTCPVCADPLTTVQNRTRFGLFAALECPRRHGHLHGHSGLLAERGLVRPLGLAERGALAKEKHRLHCLNCGGPASSRDEACSYCGTALVVLDLPRLAHSLRLRLDDMGPSPQGMGRHAAWSCRGCGAALDPGCETSCSHCGHLVVALDLPDIDPLLDAAEAELAAAAEAEARRRARFPSTRRPPGTEAATGRKAQATGPVPASGWARTLMLAGWSPLLLLLAVALALAALSVADVHWPARTPAELLRAQGVGDDPGAAWAWVEAQRLLAPADRNTQRALRRGLFDLHVRQLAGDPWPATATVGSVIDSAPSLLPVLADKDTLDRWHRGLGRHLKPVPPTEDTPLPEEATRSHGRMSPAAPGVWIDASTRNHGVWALIVENTGPAALQAGPLSVRMLVSGADGPSWRCQPAGNSGPVLRAGQRWLLVCRTTVLVRLQEDLWTAAMHGLRAGAPLKLLWHDEGISRRGAVDAAIDRLVADAASGSVRLDQFLRRHTDLRRDVPPVVAAAPTPGRAIDGAARVSALSSLKSRWTQMSDSRRRVLVLAGLLSALVVFFAGARLFGERKAVITTLLLAAPVSYLVGRGEGAASVLLVGMYLSVAVILTFGSTFTFRLYRDAVFARYAQGRVATSTAPHRRASRA